MEKDAADSGRVARAIRAHLALVWRVLRRSGLREGDADDAAQDAFWVLARRLDEVPVAAERSFLVSTALRIASDRRKTRWYRSVTEELDPSLAAGDTWRPDKALERQQALLLLDEALGALSDDQRTVFLLVEIEEMTRHEAAELLGWAPGTVASRLARARELFEAAASRIRARFKGDRV